MADFSPDYCQHLLTILKPQPELEAPESSRITVSDAVSRFAFLYEKIRNVVDYKDEHLIRKAAILRIMKRQLLLESDPHVIAERLIRELISARYLPNKTLPESLIEEVSLLIRKFQKVARVNVGSDRHLGWLRGVIAVEIEEVLVNPEAQKAFITFLYERLINVIKLQDGTIDETERRLQVYVACYRSLIKADDEILSFKLLRAYLPEWQRPQDWLESPRPIAERLIAIERRIRERLRHPLSQKFLRAVRQWATSLALLRDVLTENEKEANELLQKPDRLAVLVARKAEEKYASARGKLRRGMVRAMIYLFITKMVVALVLEAPLEQLFYKHTNYTALAINMLFPPLLMFMVGLLIRIPGKTNTDKLIKSANELLAKEPLPELIIRMPKPRRGLSRFWFAWLYAITFLASFGLIITALRAMSFTWISIAIFLFFLCIVSFFAFRLRSTVREIVVVEGRHGLTAAVVDFFSLPILRAGQWLSRSINRINIFLFIFDFLFEAPFKIFLNVLEEWFAFLKEKKEELQ